MPIPTALDSRTAVAVAGTATVLSDTVDPLSLALSGRWMLTISCTHATRGISLVRYRVRGDSSHPWGPWVTATGVSPAALATAIVEVDGACAAHLDVELTGDGGTSTASLYVVGV